MGPSLNLLKHPLLHYTLLQIRNLIKMFVPLSIQGFLTIISYIVSMQADLCSVCACVFCTLVTWCALLLFHCGTRVELLVHFYLLNSTHFLEEC